MMAGLSFLSVSLLVPYSKAFHSKYSSPPPSLKPRISKTALAWVSPSLVVEGLSQHGIAPLPINEVGFMENILGHSPILPSYDPLGIHSSSTFHGELPSTNAFGWKTSIMLSSMVTEGLSPSAATQEFTPQIDSAALVTFTSIMLMSLLLIQRTAEVEQAVQDREAALLELRKWKTRQLVGGDRLEGGQKTDDLVGNSSDDSITNQIEKALKEYERAVQEEEKLRNLVPGGWIRIVPPNAEQASDRNAREVAKKILGKDYDIGASSSSDNDVTNTDPNNKNLRPNTSSNTSLPVTAQVVLALVGLYLVCLLFFLSLDPATVSSILDDL